MGGIEYRVNSGDTLSAIARRHDVTVEVLSRLNGISDVNRIFPGQVLRIPKARVLQKTLPPMRTTYRDDGNSSSQDKPPKNIHEARKRHPELTQKTNAEVQRLVDALHTVASPSTSLADKLSATAKLAAAFPKNLGSALKKSGV
ncbi:LysM peptidoglycan-binding domain-containing protein, partial [Hyalangium sp.]|uniref:LysM peptidoglycan-binding domain-containing protein n=1 Tax=Hyalangium sp. TaxID=2028555 RepID=UPI002D4543F6